MGNSSRIEKRGQTMKTKTKIILTILIWVVGTTFVPVASTFIYWASGGHFKPGAELGGYAVSIVLFEIPALMFCASVTMIGIWS